MLRKRRVVVVFVDNDDDDASDIFFVEWMRRDDRLLHTRMQYTKNNVLITKMKRKNQNQSTKEVDAAVELKGIKIMKFIFTLNLAHTLLTKNIILHT